MVDRRAKMFVSLAGLLTTVGLANPVLASNWADPIAGGSTAEAQAVALPAGPTGIGVACASPSSSSVTVTWNPVPLATAYTLLKSTTTAGGPYKVVAVGLTTTSWASASLPTGNYWFEASASIGANWSGVASAPTPETTVVKHKSCAQP